MPSRGRRTKECTAPPCSRHSTRWCAPSPALSLSSHSLTASFVCMCVTVCVCQGCAALSAVADVVKVELQMPNIHNIPFPLQTYGISNKDASGAPFIFFPIDEPHGSIQAVVERQPNLRAKL
jgi:hypothetical protein